MKPLAVVLLLVVALGGARAVAAPPSGRADYERGARAFHDKRYAEARAAFEAAWAADHAPELLYDIAVATRRQAESDGDRQTLAAARDAYRRYLDAGAEIHRRAQAEEALAAIEAQLAPAPPTPEPATTPKPTPRLPDEPVLDPWTGAPTTGTATPTRKDVNVLAAPPRADLVAAPATEPPRHRGWVAPVVIISALAVVGLAVGLGVGLSSSGGGPSLGTVSYP